MSQFIFKKWGLKFTMALGVFLYSQMALAVDKYWVGPNGGGFTSGANWAATSGGAGGAGSPGSNDRAIFDQGSNNCDINGSINIQGLQITAGYSGTINQVSTNTVTIGSGHYSQAGGTFAGGSGFIDVNGFFTLSGGTFTSTSGTLTWANDVTVSGSAVFNHNSGTVTFDDINGRNIDVNSSITFNNLTLSKTNNNDTISIAGGDTLITVGTLTMGNGRFNGGILEARGDVTVQSTYDGGTSALQFRNNAAQNFTLTGATALFDADITVNKTGNQVTLLSALVMDATNQDLTITAGTLDIAGQNLTVNGSGGVFSNDGTIRAQGGETFSGSFDTNSGTAIYNGTGSYTSLPFGNFYNHLTFNGAGSWRHAGTLDVNGDLNIAAGTLNSNGQNINLAGNWTNSSTYTPGTNVVTLDGSSQAINGSTSFSSLSKVVSSTATLTLQAGSTTTVTGTLTLRGTASATLNIRSSSTSQANINPQGTRNVEYLDVSYSNNTNSTILNCFTGCTDSLNNTNWLFAQPSVTWTVGSQSSVSESGTMTVTAQLSAAQGADVTIPYNVGGTALSGGIDYSIPASPLTISAGSTSATITITIAGDLMDESSETVVISMTTPINATAGATTVHTATIVDDDAIPTVTLGVSSSTFAENGGTSTLTATLSAASSFDVTVNLVYSGTGIVNTDYTRSVAAIIITAGNTTGTSTLTGISDSLYEGGETVITDVSTVVNGAESGNQQATVTITDDDSAPTVSLSSTSSSISENGGTSTITATLSAVSGLDATINLVYGGTAIPTSDYTRSAASISITAGNTTGTITLTGVSDSIDDNTETILTTLDNLVNASSGTPSSVTVTIADDDTAGVTLTESGGSTSLTTATTDTYTVVLTSQPTATVTITITDTSLVSASPTTLSFTTANWNTPQTVTLSMPDDPGDTTQATITHSASSSDTTYSGITIASVVVSLTGDDSEEPSDVTANAGENLTLVTGNQATLDGSGSTGTNITYLWTITSGSGSLTDETTATPTFSTTEEDETGDTVVRLTVIDENENSDLDEITISLINEASVSQSEETNVIVGKSDPSSLVYEEASDSSRVEIVAGSSTVVLPESASTDGDYDGYNMVVTDEGYMVIATPGEENSKGKVFFSQVPVSELGGTIDLETDISASYSIINDELGNPDLALNEINLDTDNTNMTSVTGSQSDDHFGAYLSYGDIDNDGVKEILISAPGAGYYGVVYVYDQTGTLVGVIFGSEEKPVQSIMTSSYIAETLDDVFFGPNNQALNQDLHYQEPLTDSNTTGLTFFLAGSESFDDSIDLAITDSDASIETSDQFQSAAFGDINGDDKDDLILAGVDGTIYMFFGTLDSGSNIDTLSANVTLSGGSENDGFGQMVLTADVSGDGLNDLLIGAPLYGDDDTGAIYIVFGRETWASTVDVTTDTSTLLITGSTANGQIGTDILAVDTDSNGVDSIYLVTSFNTNVKVDIVGVSSESAEGGHGVSVLGASCSLKPESPQSDMKPYAIQIVFLAFAIYISLLMRKRRHP